MKKREIINIQNLTKSIRRLCLVFLFIATGSAVLLTSSEIYAEESSSGGSYTSKAVTASIAAGLYHSLFLKVNGTLWAMGYNNNGQLGDGTTNSRSTQVQVADSVAQVAAGNVHSLFIKTDGSLWVMGSNYLGQLGDGTTSDYSKPGEVAKGVVRAAEDIGRYSF